MSSQPRAICLHLNDENKNLRRCLIAPQAFGNRIKPFVSLDVLKAGELSTTDMFLMSPDSGTAIIIFLLSGEADFSDSTHKHGSLKKHDVLWILSGAGIRYSLRPKTKDCSYIKLRVALSPALEYAPAQSVCLESNLVEHDGPAQVLLGRYKNAQSGFALPALINYLVVTLAAGQEWIYEPPVNHRTVWVAAVNGEISTSNILVSADEFAIYDNSNKPISFIAQKDCIFLLGSSQECMDDLAWEKYPISSVNESSNKSRPEVAAAYEFMCS